MRARYGLGVLLTVVFLCAGCGSSPDPVAADDGATPATEPSPPEPEAIAVRATPIARGTMAALYETSATLRAEKQATVTARTHGVIRRLLVEEGDRVEAGQRLAVLENDEQTIELARARATQETRARELERAERLHDQGMLSDEAYGDALRQADETRHTAELAELQLRRTVIRAPFAGTVLLRHVDPGATVSDGTAVYDIADLDPLFADVNVPERELARLKTGQRVRLAAGDESEMRSAEIERIAPSVDASTGTVKVTVAVDGSRELRPGGFVRVEIVTEVHEQALIVPRSALVAEGRRWHVFRVGDDALAERVEVERGFEEGDRVEILGELEAGQRVISTGAAAVTEGARVDVVGDASETRASDEERGDRVAT